MSECEHIWWERYFDELRLATQPENGWCKGCGAFKNDGRITLPFAVDDAAQLKTRLVEEAQRGMENGQRRLEAEHKMLALKTALDIAYDWAVIHDEDPDPEEAGWYCQQCDAPYGDSRLSVPHQGGCLWAIVQEALSP